MPDPIRILVVDDDADVRRTIVAYLEDSDFEMLEAADGRAGLALFRDERPDLVLLDLRMPILDGLQVLAAIGAESPETPVMIVSGTGNLNDAIAALKMGASDYVTKPIHDMAVLEHAIRKALDQAGLRRENQRYREHLEAVNKELQKSLRKLEEDEAAARRVQFQLLPPRVRHFGDVELSQTLVPSANLSGDFVDFFAIDEDRVGLYITDVSGHGVSSAFVTILVMAYFSQCVEVFRRDRGDVILRPESMLQRVNDYMIQQRLDKHLTIFYGVIDTARNVLRFANGGQFPYPIFYDGHRARLLEEHGPAIGLFEFAEYEATEIDLPETFRLAILSDGVLEMPPAQDRGEREASLLARLAGPDISIGSLEEGLGLAEDREYPDDIAILIAQRRAESGSQLHRERP